MTWVVAHTAASRRSRSRCSRRMSRARPQRAALWLLARGDVGLARAVGRSRSSRCGRAARSRSWHADVRRSPTSAARRSASASSSTPISAIMLLVVTDRRRVRAGLLARLHAQATSATAGTTRCCRCSPRRCSRSCSPTTSCCCTWRGRSWGCARYLLIGFWHEQEAPRHGVDQGVPDHARRRRRLRARARASCRRRRTRSAYEVVDGFGWAAVPGRRDRRRAAAASSARWASPRRSRCTCGCPTRWPAPRPPRRSSTRRRWSRPASTSSSARCRSSQASGVGAARSTLVDRRSSPRSSAGCSRWCSTTSRRCSRTRRSASSASCSSRSAPASAVAALFHLVTHAFFKSLLFLGAGVIIHATHTQDMREMGGLRKEMPVTTRDVHDRRARARRHLPVLPASSPRTRSSRRCCTSGTTARRVGARRSAALAFSRRST